MTRTRTRGSARARRRAPSRAVDHVVGRHGPVPVHEVVQVAGGETGLVGETAVRHVPLVHEPLDRRAEGLLAESRVRAIRTPSTTRSSSTRRSSPRRAVAYVYRAVVESLLPTVTRDGAADQVGVGELLARREASRSSRRTLQPGFVEKRARRCLACSSSARQRDDVHVVRRDRRRPGDPVLVVVLFDDRRHHPARADAVAARRAAASPAVLVEEGRLERRRVVAPEVEDVADLDGGLEVAVARRTRGSGRPPRLAQVGEARVVVAARLDAAQVPAVAVRARDELPLAQASRRRGPRPRSRPGPSEPPPAPKAARISSSVAGREPPGSAS